MDGEEEAELSRQRADLAEEEPQVVPHVVLRESLVGGHRRPERVEREGIGHRKSRQYGVPQLFALGRVESLEVAAGALKKREGGRLD